MLRFGALIILLTMLALPGYAENPVKEGGREIGQGIKTIGKQTGQAFKEGGKEIGQGFKKVGRETGQALKEGSRESGQAVKKTGRSIGDWFRGLGSSFRDFFRRG